MVVTILRWAMAVLAVVTAVGALFSFALFMAFDADVWIQRARRFRHWLWLVALLWFNAEVWGRVTSTIVHWAV